MLAAVYDGLSHLGRSFDILALDGAVVVKAEEFIRERYAVARQYHLGEQLEMLGDFVRSRGICPSLPLYKNPFPRQRYRAQGTTVEDKAWQEERCPSLHQMLALADILMRRLPAVSTSRMSYGSIFKSMAQLLRHERRLVYRALIGGCVFAAMSILFSTIAMLLTAPPFSLADVWVGVLTLAGVFGALSTQWIGKWADRGYNARLTWAGCLILACSWLLLYIGGHSLLSYTLGYGAISLGLAMVHSCNQNIIFQLNPAARSRINSIYMTLYFIGGACGSALGVYAWHHGGWTAACLSGLALVIAAAFFTLLDQRYHLSQTRG